MGEQLESLTFREVHQLEHQIDSALRKIRSRKVHVTCTVIVHICQNCYSHVSAHSAFLIPTLSISGPHLAQLDRGAPKQGKYAKYSNYLYIVNKNNFLFYRK